MNYTGRTTKCVLSAASFMLSVVCAQANASAQEVVVARVSLPDLPEYRIAMNLDEVKAIAQQARTFAQTSWPIEYANVSYDPEQSAVVAGTVQPLPGDTQIDCNRVLQGYRDAKRLFAEVLAISEQMLKIAEQASASSSPEVRAALVQQMNQLVGEVRQKSQRIKQVYPPDFDQTDRKVRYTWSVLSSNLEIPSERVASYRLNVEKVNAAGFQWTSALGTIDPLFILPRGDQAISTPVVVERWMSPVNACLSDRSMELTGTIYARVTFQGISHWLGPLPVKLFAAAPAPPL